jgi:membrane associated rhomboid family serine protease
MSSYRVQGSGPYYRPSFFGGLSFFPPVIKALMISNVVIWFIFSYFLQFITLRGVRVFAILGDYLALWPLGTDFWPWQLVTYMFMHGGFWHLAFNMLALWMFGMELENLWGSRKFLLFYLVCGVGAGIANLLVAPLVGQAAPTVGASGAVFGVLIAFGMLFPNRPIYIYFLLPIKAKYFVAAYIGLELFYGVTGTTDGIAHFAHLGGAIVGFLFLLVETDLIPLRSLAARLRMSQAARGGHDERYRRQEGEIRDATFYDINTGQPAPGKPASGQPAPGKPASGKDEVNQDVIDAILDKISKGGYQSLTEDEKRILNEASRKIH